MDVTRWLFWNVDTQIDFVYPRGKLYVKGAEDLRQKWKKLTELARKKSITVINTADYHFKNSPELDETPDFINTYPEHCMANSRGADYIKETDPEDPLIFEWNKEYLLTQELFDTTPHRNLIIRKNEFDVFLGNPHTKIILDFLKPDAAVIYGVPSKQLIESILKNLNKKVKQIYIIRDAVKALNGKRLTFNKWGKSGVGIIELNDLKKLLH